MDTTPTPPVSPPPAPAPQQPVYVVPKHGMSPAAIAGIVIVVLLLGYGAYAYLTDSWPLAPMATVSPSPSASVSPSGTPDPTAGWKTYSNAQYGFELKYPGTWTWGDQNGLTTFVSPETKEAADKNRRNCNDGNDKTTCNPEQVEIDVVFAPRSDEVTPGTEKVVTFNGISFTEYEAIGLYGEKHYKTTHGGVTYDFTAYGKPILNQILSTFKFTAPTVPAGSKVYRNDTFGFEVIVPSTWSPVTLSNGVSFDSGVEETSNTVTVATNTQGKTIQSLEAELRANQYAGDVHTDVRVDGETSVRWTNNDGIPVSTLHVIHAGKIYSLTGWLLNGDIVSTFKFTQ